MADAFLRTDKIDKSALEKKNVLKKKYYDMELKKKDLRHRKVELYQVKNVRYKVLEK